MTSAFEAKRDILGFVKYALVSNLHIYWRLVIFLFWTFTHKTHYNGKSLNLKNLRPHLKTQSITMFSLKWKISYQGYHDCS